MAGATSTLRPAGLPSGYPAEIDSNVKIRWVDNLLINMSERSANLLKYLGGPSQFSFTNPKVEWVEDDVWSRRLSHGGLAAAGTTALTVTGASHRYPIGTLLLVADVGEILRVNAHADANTLTVTRDADGQSLAATVASTDEIIVAGLAMSEDESYAFRPSAIVNLPYNYAQIMHVGLAVTFRRQSTALYGLRGTDLDYISANTVAEMFVAMDEGIVQGTRYEGAATTTPAQMGGLRYYITAANGAVVSDIASAALARKDIDDDLQELWYAVGPEKMARALVISAWGQRKITSFFSSAERLPPKTTSAGVVIGSYNSDFGPIDVLMHTSVRKDEAYLVNRDMIKMGHYAGLGRPHLLQLAAPSAVAPKVERAFYADVSAMIKGVHGMGHIHTFSVSA